jgi:hypothetical protein
MEEIETRYSSVFKGEGLFRVKLHLELDDSVKPVKMPLRRVPIAMKEKHKKELIKLENKCKIAKVNIPTDWISSLVIEKKRSNALRICNDPKILNTSLKRSHFFLPVVEDVLSELNSAKLFSKSSCGAR